MTVNSVTGLVTVMGKLPSLNKMYQIGAGGRVFLNPDVKRLKERVRECLIKDGWPKKIAAMKQAVNSDKKQLAYLTLTFVLKDDHKFWERDVTNLVKGTEDAIQDITKMNDSFNVKVRLNKILNDVEDNPKLEYIIPEFQIIAEDDCQFKWSDFINEANTSRQCGEVTGGGRERFSCFLAPIRTTDW